MKPHIIGTDVSGHVFEHPAGYSEGELACRFEVAGELAGVVRLTWNPRARLKEREEAKRLVTMLAGHVGHIQAARHPRDEDPPLHSKAFESALVDRIRAEKEEALAVLAELAGAVRSRSPEHVTSLVSSVVYALLEREGVEIPA